jgi:uncharacterized protein
MNRVIHFEMQVANPEKAAAFYKDVFGWKIEKWGGEEQEYYVISSGNDDEPGINGGLMKSPDGEARTYNTIEVSSVDEYTEKVLAAGGEVALPKMPVPGVGYLAYFKDPQGVLFGVMHSDPNAK